MKKLILLFVLLLAVKLILAQVPRGIKYQAVIRDSNGEVLSEQNIALKISILQSSPTGSTVYSEEHAAQTNTHGLVNLTIGQGTILSGDFSGISWDNGPFFIKVELDAEGGTNYKEMGTSQLLSVPYALYSGQTGEVAQYDSDTLFVVKDNDGNVVFAVFPDGAKVYVNEDNPKGPIGGFAVSGRNTNKNHKGEYEVMRVTPYGTQIYVNDTSLGKGPIGGFAVSGRNTNKGEYEVMKVTADSTRIFINESAKGPIGGFAVSGRNTNKGPKGEYEVMRVTPDGTTIYLNDASKIKGPIGGFAVSGRNTTKGEYKVMKVTPDSTRIYINEQEKGPVGGFAVSGRNNAKGTTKKFMDITTENYFIGHESGQQLKAGLYNSTLGYESGYSITNGESNSFMGYQSGYNTSVGIGNLFIGYQTGFANQQGNYNTFLGYQSGYSNSSGLNNSFLGSFAGYSNTIGSYNTFVGDSSGYSNTQGDENSFYGDKAGFSNTIGSNNVFIGNLAGYNNISGESSIFIGNSSGYSNYDGYSNIFIGNRSGYNNHGGYMNIFIGYYAGYSNLNGNYNVFQGYQAGFSNTSGTRNTFSGYYSGRNNTTGDDNIFIGNESGYSNTSGNYNVFLGSRSGTNGNGFKNVLIGYEAGRYNVSSSNNVFLGHKAGRNHDTGNNNVFIGNDAGLNHDDGENNIFIGPYSGRYAKGDGNICIGQRAGENNTTGYSNVFVSVASGMENTTGYSNVLIGDQAGWNNTTGYENVVIGRIAGWANESGHRNVFIGYGAGNGETNSNRLYISNTAGGPNNAFMYGEFDNRFLRLNGELEISGATGNAAAQLNLAGGSNSGHNAQGYKLRISNYDNDDANYTYPIYVLDENDGVDFWLRSRSSAGGYSRAYFQGKVGIGTTNPSHNLTLRSSSNNVTAIKMENTTAYRDYVLQVCGSGVSGRQSNFEIWNASYSNPSFVITDNNHIAINTTNPGSYRFYVNGSSYSTGGWHSSDIRYKESIENIDGAVDLIRNVRGVSFQWKADDFPDKGFEKGKHYGVIAQEIENILPELTKKGPDGDLAVAYQEFIPILIEAVKTQDDKITKLENENQELKKTINKIYKMLENK